MGGALAALAVAVTEKATASVGKKLDVVSKDSPFAKYGEK